MGDILHGMKAGDGGFDGFGEAYFSSVGKGEIKGWKKHSIMTLNLLVPLGEIEFVIHDGREFFTITLSKANHHRLTVWPNLWLAFKGLAPENMLLNLASHIHEPSESKNLPLKDIDYKWRSH